MSLYAAAIAGDADAISKLETEADTVDGYGKTILHIESINGNAEHVQFILRQFESKNLLIRLGNQKETALAWATYYGHTKVVELLIDAARNLPSSSSADNNLVSSFQDFLRHADNDSETALNIAVRRGHTAIVKLLVEADPSDKHIQNDEGKTPIYLAVEKGYIDIIKVICTTCTALSLDGPDGSTVLHAAISNLDHGFEVVEVLLGAARLLFSSSEHDDDTYTLVSPFQSFLRKGDEDLNTALHIAVIQCNVAIIKLLLEADPSYTHIQNEEGKTPMYIAVEKEYNDIVEIICSTCTPQSLDGPDGTALRIKKLDQGENPGGTLYEIFDVQDALFEDAIAGDADAMAKLEMEADKLNKDEETILHVESKKGNTENVRFILREFAHKNLLVKQDNQKETALTWAASYGHTEVAEVLIDAARHLPPSANDNPVTSFQAFLRLGDKDMDTALHIAVINNEIAIVKLLVEADPSDRHKQNNDGKTPIYIAVKKGYKEIVKLICTTCTAPSFEGPGVKTALHAAIRDPDHDIEVVEVLIGAASLLSSSSDDDNSHSLASFLQDFLRQGDKDMNTALHMAVMQGNLATAKLLVEADPSDQHPQNNKGETPIYIAAERGYYNIVKMICTTCSAPPDLDAPDGSTTVIHVAIKNLDKGKKEDRDVIKIIIEAFKRANTFEDVYEVNERLIRLFNRTDEKRCIILELAVEGNHLDVVELILAQNPAYHRHQWHPDFIGLMPLIYKAKDKEYNDMVKLLTETYQREVTARRFRRFAYMPRFIPAITSYQEESVVSLLNEYNAKDLVTFADNIGWTALHHAAYHEFDSIIGKIVEAQQKFGHPFVYEDMVSTPFHVAAAKGYTSTVKLLLELWPSSTSSIYTAVDKNGQNILHLAALQSKKEMIQCIFKKCPEEYKNKFVNEQDNNGDTPLHLLIWRGCFIPELLRYEGFDIRVENKKRWTPPDMLYFEDQIINDQVQIRMALDHIKIDQKRGIFSSSVLSSKRERKDGILNTKSKVLIREKYRLIKEDTHAIADCFADAIAGDPIFRAALEMKANTRNEEEKTILHIESLKGNTERVQFIVMEFANKNLLVKLDGSKQTALHLAADNGHTKVVEVLLDAAKHNLPSFSVNPVSPFQEFIRQAKGQRGNTALHLAVLNNNVAIVKLLVEADPDDSHVQNYEGKTPIYIAMEKGYKDIIKEICTTCKALSLEGPGGKKTALHALIQNMGQEGASDMIRMIVDAAKRWSSAEDPSLVKFKALFGRTDESGSTVLQLAVEKNFVEAVKLILPEDPAYQPGPEIKRNGLMRLIHKAIDNEYSNDIIELLSNAYEAGIDPIHKDVLTLILAIQRLDEGSVLRLLRVARHLVTFKEDNGWTPLHYAVYHEFDSILDSIIKAQKDVGHSFVYGNMESMPFYVAVKYGYTSTLVKLMELWPASSPASIAATASSPASIAANSPYTVVDEDGQNILHLAAASASRKEMVQGILKYCPEKYKDEILKQQDIRGDTPLHLLISHGCFIPELIKHKGLDTMAKNKKDCTPRDMLYVEDHIVADQVHIKIALDDAQTNQSVSKLWGKRKEKKTDIWKCNKTPSSKQKKKDGKFEDGKKDLMDKKHEQMKKELETYKTRTNTQILVTALITTVTFTVGFTMPGGLHQSGEVHEGLVVLSRKRAFNVFMVADALALLMSTSSLFFYFLESMNEDPRQVSILNASSTVLNILSVMGMMLTFIAGTYVVLSDTPVLAIAICTIGSLFFLLIIIIWIIKIVYDRQLKKNKD